VLRLLKRVARAAVPAAGLLALFMLQVHPARLAGATPLRPAPSCSPIRPGASSSFSISRIRPSS